MQHASALGTSACSQCPLMRTMAGTTACHQFGAPGAQEAQRAIICRCSFSGWLLAATILPMPPDPGDHASLCCCPCPPAADRQHGPPSQHVWQVVWLRGDRGRQKVQLLRQALPVSAHAVLQGPRVEDPTPTACAARAQRW